MVGLQSTFNPTGDSSTVSSSTTGGITFYMWVLFGLSGTVGTGYSGDGAGQQILPVIPESSFHARAACGWSRYASSRSTSIAYVQCAGAHRDVPGSSRQGSHGRGRRPLGGVPGLDPGRRSVIDKAEASA